MAFKKVRKFPQFADLKVILAQTKQTENPLYQAVQEIIERLADYRIIDEERLAEKADKVPSDGSGPPANSNASYLTKDDESVALPNSVQLLAGDGITLDDTVPNKLTISSSVSGDEWSVLTNGNVLNTELIYADGDVIMIHL